MNRNILLTLLLLLFATMTVSATDIIRYRGCRVGTPNPLFSIHRAPTLTDSENPYTGNRRQLVVLASFQDQDFMEDHETTLQTWNKIFNAENYAEGQFVGSVHDYFLAQSYGQFDLTFDLVLVELPGGLKKYRSTYSHDENSQYMVDDIVDKLQTQHIDWSLYDWDGDAFVDQLLIVYAGKGMNVDGDSNTIWPHQWWLSQHLNQETADPNDYRSYITVTTDDKEYYVDCYCCVQEYVNGGGIKTSFGTICHEYSHCFGFPDFYSNNSQVVGSWDIMDNGSFNDEGFRPCNYSAHERMFMGWLTPIELTGTAVITDMPDLADEPQAYLIRNDGAENEYYIIENRQQRGWDMQLPGCGIVVFDVDFDLNCWTGFDDVPNTDTKKRYTIFPANNKPRSFFRSGWAYPYIENEVVANDELTNTSQPAATLNNANTDGELLMSKPVTQMWVDANGIASFIFMADETTSIADTQCSAYETRLSSWHLTDGRKLSDKPSARGIYIHEGRKVVIK